MTTAKKPKKIKVSALAKQLKLTSKELIKILKDLGVEAKTAASSIDAENAKVVKEVIAPKKEAPVVPPEEPEEEAKVIPPKVEEEVPSGPVIETDDISVKKLAGLIQV